MTAAVLDAKGAAFDAAPSPAIPKAGVFMDEIMRARLAPVGLLSDEAAAALLPVATEWRDRAARILAFAEAEIDADVVPITAFMRSEVLRTSKAV